MLRQALAGHRIAVTGATGFLGTAIAERVLRCLPDTELVLVVRPGRRGAADRVQRDILRNDCFDRLRRELGDRFDAEMARRAIPVAGDVTVDGLALDDEGRELLAGCTTVVHSAATVSFDSPLDSAVEVNLLGPSRVAAVVRELAPAAHLVAVSTAYVAGSRRGPAPELPLSKTPFALSVPWRAEVEHARRSRSDVEAESRSPDRLARLRAQARAELGAAGSPLLADKTERLRAQWAEDRMVELGKARAQALGWPDAYAYSKALGEWALLEGRGELAVSIVRPSIIEAALAEPHPGWIRGFRMADPVIISYAKGLLREFPGIPEGIIDVIPVDIVVAAIIAVAARGPLAEPDVVHAASGARNPLRYGQLVNLVREWFSEHPLADDRGQPIEVPEWKFPGRRRVQNQLRQATRVLRQTEKVLQSLPLRGEKAEIATRVEERRDEAERALGYVELYGAYTETEAIFSVRRLLELAELLSPDEREEFCLDPAVVDWSHFCHDIYLPAVVAHARVRLAGQRRAKPALSRAERGLRAVLSPERHLAVFDLENTLVATNVVDSYAWLATRRMELGDRARFTLKTLLEAPRMLALDMVDRGDFLRWFYRRYEDADVRDLRQGSWDLTSDLLLAKSFPAGIRRVRQHRALGHRTLLITGALDFVIEPFRPLFDDVVCAQMRPAPDGALSGELEHAPPTGEARALIMADYADAHGLSLSECVAYADSTSDLPMLEVAGYPVAVNPETKLAAIARKRGWHVEQWPRSPGYHRGLLPFGPVMDRKGTPRGLTEV
ncbi:MAG TPA: SDR family oxidoreductase [Acidimicrobiales bacterium]|nr:SDR family oxidoreductase [Acidimicrobiales bacterium]